MYVKGSKGALAYRAQTGRSQWNSWESIKVIQLSDLRTGEVRVESTWSCLWISRLREEIEEWKGSRRDSSNIAATVSYDLWPLRKIQTFLQSRVHFCFALTLPCAGELASAETQGLVVIQHGG